MVNACVVALAGTTCFQKTWLYFGIPSPPKGVPKGCEENDDDDHADDDEDDGGDDADDGDDADVC